MLLGAETGRHQWGGSQHWVTAQCIPWVLLAACQEIDIPIPLLASQVPPSLMRMLLG